MKNVDLILTGSDEVKTLTTDEQTELIEQLKTKKVFQLEQTQKENVINFLTEVADKKLAIDYLFHVLDNEITYPIDDDEVKTLFADERMKSLKDQMMDDLQQEEAEAEVTEQ